MSDAVEHCTSRDLATYRFSYVDDGLAICDQRTFDRLHEYSCSRPTGIADGKVWKCDRWFGMSEADRECHDPALRWLLMEYIVEDDHGDGTISLTTKPRRLVVR